MDAEGGIRAPSWGNRTFKILSSLGFGDSVSRTASSDSLVWDGKYTAHVLPISTVLNPVLHPAPGLNVASYLGEPLASWSELPCLVLLHR